MPAAAAAVRDSLSWRFECALDVICRNTPRRRAARPLIYALPRATTMKKESDGGVFIQAASGDIGDWGPD